MEESFFTVPLGGGVLSLRISMERRRPGYGEILVEKGKVLAFCNSKGDVIELGDISGIRELAETEGFDLEEEIGARPEEFARLIAVRLSVGSVLRPTWRFAYFQEVLGIDLESNRPRVEGGKLRFVATN